MNKLRGAIALIVLSVAALTADYAPSIGPDPDAAALMRRLQIRYAVQVPGGFWFRPMHAAGYGGFFHRAGVVDTFGSLCAGESLLLDQLRTLVESRRNLAGFVDSAGQRRVFLHGMLVDSMGVGPGADGETAWHARGTIAPELRGSVAGLSWYTRAEISTAVRSDTLFYPSTYQPYDGPSYNLYGRADSSHVRSFDMVYGGIRYHGPRLSVEAALDNIRMGPAVRYPLALSGAGAPILYARAFADLGPVRYHHLVGELKSQKDRAKYLYAHRCEARMFHTDLTCGINEYIVNGSTTGEQDSLRDPANRLRSEYYGRTRRFEWAYALPFMPFAFTEHWLGDLDNALLSFDVSCIISRRIRVYGEVLLDDITAPWTILSDDWGNKWGVMAGAEWAAVIRGRRAGALVEYARVEPWVYTHFYGGSHRFSHYGMPLGLFSGPNSDALFLRAEAEAVRGHTAWIGYELVRRNPNVRGGDIRHVFQDGVDSPVKQFPGPGPSRSHRIEVGWATPPWRTLRIRGSAGFLSDPRRSGPALKCAATVGR